MLSEWPIIWIRTDTRGQTSPLLHMESMKEKAGIMHSIKNLPAESLVMLNPAYKSNIYSGIIIMTKEREVSFEFVPSIDYRKLSGGKVTPEITCIKNPGKFFRMIVNDRSSNIDLNREIASNIVKEINEKEHLDKFDEIMEKENTLLSLEFDWHRRTGLLFTDLDTYGQ